MKMGELLGDEFECSRSDLIALASVNNSVLPSAIDVTTPYSLWESSELRDSLQVFDNLCHYSPVSRLTEQLLPARVDSFIIRAAPGNEIPVLDTRNDHTLM